jgi:predicted metal-binding membrane protein
LSSRAFAREDYLVIIALAVLAALAWVALFASPMPMPGEAGVRAAGYFALTALMWVVMMVAMMTPAVAPVVLLFDRSQGRAGDRAHGRTVAFVGGYFTTWLVFSIAVSLLQLALIDIEWVDTMMKSRSRALSGALLVAIGVYQWGPLKAACLRHCRNPIEFLTRHFRPGLAGAWRMGIGHGAYCVGCCGLLMLALFVGGVMSPLWIVAVTALVVIEKLLPHGALIGRSVGIALIVAGAWWLATGGM